MPLYTFSCFKVPEVVCNKTDAISRAFWWGHDQSERKLHLVSWDKICRPRKEGGLGLKKFGLMNQAMLAKQFWRIGQNPQSLISKTFKAKYFPNSSIYDCVPKPHHSWFWRSIINQKNNLLKEGRRIIRNGANIPLTHTAWFPYSLVPIPTPSLRQHNLSNGSVANLIDSTTHTWKPRSSQILVPLPY